MFQGLELSGVLLCYGPLALVIGGFILFAALTDANARRKYLRRLDPRPEKERLGEDATVARRAELVAATPGGMVVKLDPVAAASPAQPAAPAKPAAAQDDFKKLEGIGPKINSVLHEAGIATFAELATKTPEELRAILDAAGMTSINDPTTWPKQAGLAAEGKWDELEAYQNTLQGGRAA